MSELMISDFSCAPNFVEKCYNRVTQGMIICPVRIVSRDQLKNLGEVSKDFSDFPWEKYEREAKGYYESRGYEVIRLEHFASAGVGGREHIFPKSKILGEYLRHYFSESDYSLYIHRSEEINKFLVLNGVYPTDYSISFYPPDFLVVDKMSGEWQFVEVKGPKDKLRFRQANWFVNLIPKTWKYEIFASLDRQFEDTFMFIPNGPRAGSRFEEMHRVEISEVEEYRALIKKNSKGPAKVKST